MTLGELFLEALSSGVITQPEIDWVLAEQSRFSRPEQAALQRLGRLLDQGGDPVGLPFVTPASASAPGAQ
jgi:hypothetical protein